MKLRRELNGRPYEKKHLELINALRDGPLGVENEENLSSLFCSELVAEAYQSLGLLNVDKPSNEYTPADFSALEKLQLRHGYLGVEIKLM